MKSFVMILCVSVWSCLAAHAVTVNGVATLSGRQNHSGIKVLFREVSPSAQTDSTLTNSWGAFLMVLQPGVYDVEYTHEDFALYRLPNQILLFDTALDSVLLMPPLSGYLSGSLGPGDFQVTDSIVVAANASLTILPGTRLWFDGMHRFTIRGLLTAVGAWNNSIVFTRRYAMGPDTSWNGIVMWNASDLTQLEYVVVEYASRNYDEYPFYHDGAALFCQGTDVHISDSRFRHNFVAGSGSHLYFAGCSPNLYGCAFEGNEGYAQGVVMWDNASPVIQACSFRQNHGTALEGGGNSHTTIMDCEFVDNAGYGAIRDISASNISIDRCVFFASSSQSGSAISLGDLAVMTRCTLFGRGDSYYGMIRMHGTAIISSSVAFVRAGGGINFNGAAQSQVRYCELFVPNGQELTFDGNDPNQGPPAIGLIALTNANGDSCDTYYNIFSDPQFVDTANGDYHLLASSPCIDAGDPELPLDPDGTVADIGAFYFDQLSADETFAPQPASFTLSAYPNPFNSETRIVFNLPRAGQTELKVYDIMGREEATLLSGLLTAGRHEANLNASGWASGIYFCRVQSGAMQQTRKITLLK